MYVWIMVAAGGTSAPCCACLIVGEIFFQSTQLSGFVLNGKVTVVLKGVSVIV